MNNKWKLIILTVCTTFLISTAKSTFAAKKQGPAPAIAANLQPVNGNQKFFGDKPVFNTFHGRPVPLTFFIKGDKEKLNNPALVLYLPDSVKLLETFQGNNLVQKDQVFKMSRSKVTIHDKSYWRYTTIKDFSKSVPKGFKPAWRGFRITVALDAPKQVKNATIYWAMANNGKELSRHRCTVKFLTPLPIPSNKARGQFKIGLWDTPDDLAYHSKTLQKDVADLLLSAGVQEVGAYLHSDSRWGKFEKYLHQRGIRLVVQPPTVSQGPMNVTHWRGGSPSSAGTLPAIGPKGKKSDRFAAPIPMLENQKFLKDYAQHVSKQIADSAATGKYVKIDYEPWSWPKRFGFDPKTLATFKKRFNITEKLTPKLVLSKYRKQWTQFWLHLSTRMLKLMAKDIRAASPEAHIITYTYFHDYDRNPQWKIFQNIPKDTRVEAKIFNSVMLSSYNYNGRKLVDSLRMSKRYIPIAKISVIASIARRIDLQPWVRKGADLSPQRIYQKAVLCAAMGVKRFWLFPGKYIDGAFYTALGKASCLIWAHEKFYYQGKNIRKQIDVSASANGKPSQSSAYAYTAQLLDGKILVSLFNFTNEPLNFTIKNNNRSATVKAHGVKLIEFNNQ